MEYLSDRSSSEMLFSTEIDKFATADIPGDVPGLLAISHIDFQMVSYDAYGRGVLEG
jgi:hypothetical protein